MIHTRRQLVDWLVANVGDRVLQNALQRDEVVNLGGFAPLPTSHNYGWLVRAGSHTYIAVAEDRRRLGRFYWFRAPGPTWETWIGDTSTEEVFRGDDPDVFQEYKDERQRLLDLAASDRLHTPSDRSDPADAAVNWGDV